MTTDSKAKYTLLWSEAGSDRTEVATAADLVSLLLDRLIDDAQSAKLWCRAGSLVYLRDELESVFWEVLVSACDYEKTNSITRYELPKGLGSVVTRAAGSAAEAGS